MDVGDCSGVSGWRRGPVVGQQCDELIVELRFGQVRHDRQHFGEVTPGVEAMSAAGLGETREEGGGEAVNWLELTLCGSPAAISARTPTSRRGGRLRLAARRTAGQRKLRETCGHPRATDVECPGPAVVEWRVACEGFGVPW